MARRFRKIRYDEKKGQVTLIWEDGKAHEDKYSLECMENHHARSLFKHSKN